MKAFGDVLHQRVHAIGGAPIPLKSLQQFVIL
jgi:hypothetical protein